MIIMYKRRKTKKTYICKEEKNIKLKIVEPITTKHRKIKSFNVDNPPQVGVQIEHL